MLFAAESAKQESTQKKRGARYERTLTNKTQLSLASAPDTQANNYNLDESLRQNGVSEKTPRPPSVA